jgi:hypothetical protein
MIETDPAYVDPRVLAEADAPDEPELVAAVDHAFARVPDHVRIVFADELAAFRLDLIKQINGAFAALGKRIERRVEKRLGDRCEALVLSVLQRAGYARAAREVL